MVISWLIGLNIRSTLHFVISQIVSWLIDFGFSDFNHFSVFIWFVSCDKLQKRYDTSKKISFFRVSFLTLAHSIILTIFLLWNNQIKINSSSKIFNTILVLSCWTIFLKVAKINYQKSSSFCTKYRTIYNFYLFVWALISFILFIQNNNTEILKISSQFFEKWL